MQFNQIGFSEWTCLSNIWITYFDFHCRLLVMDDIWIGSSNMYFVIINTMMVLFKMENKQFLTQIRGFTTLHYIIGYIIGIVVL